MILAHKIALDATMKQRRYFERAAGCDRFVWNLAVEEWDRQYAEYRASAKAGGKPLKMLKPTGAKLKKAFNEFKYEAFPWLSGIHRDAHADPFERLANAWSKYFKNMDEWKRKAQVKKAQRAAKGLPPFIRKDGRTDDDLGKPDFHKRGVRDSFYVANDKLTVIRDKKGSRVRLPAIGEVRMIEDLRFQGKIMGAVVSRHGQRWFISIQVNVPDKKARWKKLKAAKSRIVGVDLGVKTAAVIYDGLRAESLDSPKPLKAALERLRRENRKMARREKRGKNHGKTVRRVQSIHATIHDIRKDWLDKLTTKLCRENQAVVIEDLNVSGMLRNDKLARAISDVGFGEFRRQMEYKAALYGTHLIIVDRWYPSSKTCSHCGAVKESLSLSERVFHCGQCGFEMDRDENAAVNLRERGISILGARAGNRVSGSKVFKGASAKEDKYPRLAGNQRLGRGRAGSGLAEPGTKPCAHLRTS